MVDQSSVIASPVKTVICLLSLAHRISHSIVCIKVKMMRN